MLSIDSLLKNIKEWFTKENRKTIFFLTFIVGLFVHFELYANELLAYDGYWHYGTFLAKGWEISLGRFLIPFSDLFRGTIVVSVLTTTLSLICISLSTIFLTETLKIKKGYLKMLIGILLVVTPTVSLTLMYPYTAFGYSLAMLFSIFSIYFLSKEKNKKNITFSCLCIIITLAFYQAYLCFITTLFVITYLCKIIEKEKVTIKEFFVDLFIIAIGMVLYYICFNIIVKVLNLNITDYSNGSSILSLETLKNLLHSIQNTYITFYQFYFTDEILNNLSWYRHFLNGAMFFLIIINFVIIMVQKKRYQAKSKIIALLVLIFTFPIFACSIEIIAQARTINLLMASSLYLPILLLLKQNEMLKETTLTNGLMILSFLVSCLLIWTYILSNNATYVATDLYNQQMYSVGNSIVEKIKEDDEITENTPIVIAGKLEFSLQNDKLLNLTNFDVSSVNIWTWQIFLQDHLGLGRNICNFEEAGGITKTEEFCQMPIFPKDDSVKIINGIAVVKIGY